MPLCVECSVKIDRKYSDIIDCDICKASFHIKCVNVSVDEMNAIKRENKEWNCKKCAEVSKNEYQKIIITLNDMSTFMRNRFDEIQIAINCINVLKDENEILKSENLNMKKRLSLIELQLDKIEESSCSNVVEIFGIPENQNEDVRAIVKKVCDSGLGMNVNDTQILNCFRTNSNKKEVKSNRIMVFCQNKELRDEIVKRGHDKKNSLFAKNFGFTSNEKVYINESLTTFKRNLLFKANEIKKNGKCKFVWVRDGNIMMRKNEGERILYIKTCSDLDKV